MKKALVSLLAVAVVLTQFVGCNRQDPDEKESVYTLIDEGRTGEAVEKARTLYRSEPSDENRLVLASALVAKAGIRVAETIPVIRRALDESAWSDENQVVVRDDLSDALEVLERFKTLLNAVPTVSPSGRPLLREAQNLLRKNKWDDQRRAAGYAGFISLVFINTDLQALSKFFDRDFELCAENARSVIPKLESLLLEARDFVYDMIILAPIEDQAKWDENLQSLKIASELVEQIKKMELEPCR